MTADVSEDEVALRAVTVYGGVGYGPQISALKGGVQIVVGTPGRIQDHLERRTFTLDDLDMLVLDEADEMLSMGFYPAMRRLKRYLPQDRRSYMFSATMPPKVRSLSREFLNEPGFLSLSVGQVGVDEIEHTYYPVDAMEKDRALVRLIEMENPESAIIFTNTRREVEYLHQFLQNYGYDADAISGDLQQKAREKVMNRIRAGQLRFLVATDVAARGIDISDLSHVFMYDVPQDPEYYIHRSGRTARAGKTGRALVLTTFEDERLLKSIVHRYDLDIERREVPSPEDVAARVAERMTVVFEEQMRDKSNLERERLRRFIPLVEQLAREEPEVLAMLVDEAYHQHLHAQPEQPAEEDAEDDGDTQGRRKKRRKN
jgi:ATP-dependent RNA helicase DeaD